jgi:hypothetical protein
MAKVIWQGLDEVLVHFAAFEDPRSIDGILWAAWW